MFPLSKRIQLNHTSGPLLITKNRIPQSTIRIKKENLLRGITDFYLTGSDRKRKTFELFHKTSKIQERLPPSLLRTISFSRLSNLNLTKTKMRTISLTCLNFRFQRKNRNMSNMIFRQKKQLKRNQISKISCQFKDLKIIKLSSFECLLKRNLEETVNLLQLVIFQANRQIQNLVQLSSTASSRPSSLKFRLNNIFIRQNKLNST